MTSEEASRPTGAEEGLRLLAASATEGVASPVGICENEEIASPQDGQNRAVSGASVEHVGQRIKPENGIGKESLRAPQGRGRGQAPSPRLQPRAISFRLAWPWRGSSTTCLP